MRQVERGCRTGMTRRSCRTGRTRRSVAGQEGLGEVLQDRKDQEATSEAQEKLQDRWN